MFFYRRMMIKLIKNGEEIDKTTWVEKFNWFKWKTSKCARWVARRSLHNSPSMGTNIFISFPLFIALKPDGEGQTRIPEKFLWIILETRFRFATTLLLKPKWFYKYVHNTKHRPKRAQSQRSEKLRIFGKLSRRNDSPSWPLSCLFSASKLAQLLPIRWDDRSAKGRENLFQKSCGEAH